jgi:phosphatidylglycerophosphate synthase
MNDVEQTKADCYADGDRGFMVWSQNLRAAALRPLLRLLARLGVTADVVTLVSLLLGLAFCPVYFFSKPLALILLALHVLADGLDGPVARFSGTASRKGSFTDTMADQIVITATTITLIVGGELGVLPGGLYIFTYTVVIAFAMIRNALSLPFSWLIRPRFFIYAWLPVSFYLLPGSLDYVIWAFVVLLVGKTVSGYVRIRRRL